MLNMSMKYKYRIWFHGLIAAAVGAIGNGITNMLVDPNDFNPFGEGSWVKLGTVIFVSSLISVALYLKEHPLPSPDKDTDYKSVVKEHMDELTGTGNGK